MIKVLIVEDSLTVRMVLRKILESDPKIKVVGMVDSGEAALRFLAAHKAGVDVVTMDIIMPGMDGFTAARRIMETTPLPIVIVSAACKSCEAGDSFKAVEAGAVAIIEKPAAAAHPDFPRISRELIRTVTIMSEVKVVTHRARTRKKKPSHVVVPGQGQVQPIHIPGRVELVAIGSSTGGPPVLRTILSLLSPGFPVPVLIVQHIGTGFVGGLARWLEQETGFPVRIAGHDEHCIPGHAYLAPDGCHLGIGIGYRIFLDKSGPENGQRPSVSFLFRSAAKNYAGCSVGVLLSGMGVDGARELKLMKDGGCVTIVQDEESCVVFGMPGEAAALGAAHYVLPPVEIAGKILRFVQKKELKTQ